MEAYLIFSSIVSVLIGEEITWKAGDKRSLKYIFKLEIIFVRNRWQFVLLYYARWTGVVLRCHCLLANKIKY